MSNRVLTFAVLASVSLILAVFTGHFAVQCHRMALGRFEHPLEVQAPETSVVVTLPEGGHAVHAAPPGGICPAESWEVPSMRVEIIGPSGRGFEWSRQARRCPSWVGNISLPEGGDIGLLVHADDDVQLVVSSDSYIGVFAGLRWHATIVTAALATPMIVFVWYVRRKRAWQ